MSDWAYVVGRGGLKSYFILSLKVMKGRKVNNSLPVSKTVRKEVYSMEEVKNESEVTSMFTREAAIRKSQELYS